MTTKTFTYDFADDPNTTFPELRERSGQRVTVLDNLRDETQKDPSGYYDYDSECGKMFTIVFADGYEAQAFENELGENE